MRKQPLRSLKNRLTDKNGRRSCALPSFQIQNLNLLNSLAKDLNFRLWLTCNSWQHYEDGYTTNMLMGSSCAVGSGHCFTQVFSFFLLQLIRNKCCNKHPSAIAKSFLSHINMSDWKSENQSMWQRN